MSSFTIKSLLIGASAVCVFGAPAQLDRRDAATITQDMKDVNSNLIALTEASNSYKGGLLDALPLTTAEGNLEKSIKAASHGAQASDQIDSENSKAIIAFINTQLQPNIGKTLEALSAKKPEITKAKLTGKTASDVATLHKLTDSLGASLIGKASDDQKDAGKQALAKIDANFASATQTWGTSGADTSSSRMVRRDAAAITSDLKNVNSKLVAMTDVTNAWSGGLIKAIPLTEAESNLETSIKEATVGGKGSEQINSQNSMEIISYVTTTLQPNINKVLSALAAKKPQFTKAHLSGKVSSDVATLQKLTNTLAATLVEKAAADQKDAGKKAVAQIDSDFAGATKTWGDSDVAQAGPATE